MAAFPHDLTAETAPTALKVYRQVLAQQPDQSVTIISVGFLNNLHDLLKAEPELVKRKVKELVVMAGRNNDNFNLSRHNLVAQSEYVIRHWPTPLVISQHGGRTLTGARLAETPPENPVREAYLEAKLSDREFVDIIEPLMIQPPGKKLAAGKDSPQPVRVQRPAE